ncbi:ribosome small subunit-dependent GTPase A [Sinobaca sp. H24]|uniref:ribosome small subunit-dependent GTPase A n=1 Tax=Sinobaca sp. H24 TaxID=2923376 RepID=UPI00207ADB56|nr:ribosome small subunit-dependent GTPase A [Sinobaca sp. H24]
MREGLIIKALSGFYYVKNDDGVFQCRGRGLFRKQKISPLVGDRVEFDADNDKEGYVQEIKERKNELVRPSVANIDQGILVFSAVEPVFSTMLLDRFLVHLEAHDIEPVIVVTKKDLASPSEQEAIEKYADLYRSIGYSVYFLSVQTPESLEQISHLFAGKLSIFAGQSGVGKSTLLNYLNPKLQLETGVISDHLKRGKHTTRHVELVEVFDGLVADTPGFSSLEFTGLLKENVDIYFPEMAERLPDCKFRGCKHIKEPGCAVTAAWKEGSIADHRYQHYLQFYKEIADIRRY